MNIERRRAPRASTRVYFNKYIDGHPYLCEALELSTTGMLVRRVNEPDAPRAAYAVELAKGPLEAGAERVWLCASPVWQSGDLEALAFVGHSEREVGMLASLIAESGEARA